MKRLRSFVFTGDPSFFHACVAFFNISNFTSNPVASKAAYEEEILKAEKAKQKAEEKLAKQEAQAAKNAKKKAIPSSSPSIRSLTLATFYIIYFYNMFLINTL